jgi:hypothetical protein
LAATTHGATTSPGPFARAPAALAGTSSRTSAGHLLSAASSPNRTQVLVTQLNRLVIHGQRLRHIGVLRQFIRAECGDCHLLVDGQFLDDLADLLRGTEVDLELLSRRRFQNDMGALG